MKPKPAEFPNSSDRTLLNTTNQMNMSDDFSLSIPELQGKTNDFLLKLKQQ